MGKQRRDTLGRRQLWRLAIVGRHPILWWWWWRRLERRRRRQATLTVLKLELRIEN